LASLQLLRGVFSIVTINNNTTTGTGTRYSLQLLYGLSPYSPGVDAYNSRKNKRIGLHKNRSKRSGILTLTQNAQMPIAGNALCFTGVAICNGPEDKAYSQAKPIVPFAFT